jgi:hypothetical protein
MLVEWMDGLDNLQMYGGMALDDEQRQSLGDKVKMIGLLKLQTVNSAELDYP